MGCGQEGKTEMKRRVELLAPAGSFESMEAAIRCGADAVYMGGPRFGARAYADNPQTEGVVRALDYVHLRGKKLYLTVNTLFKQNELAELYGYLLPFYEAGLDAVLVQDLGVLRQIRRDFPDLPVHASTQMTVMDADGARALLEQGVSRVVTARELTLPEMRTIADTGIELEVFVHGSICYCYSGQCLLSSLIGGRSGNRGRCAQPCRLPYEVQKGQGGRRSGQKYVLSLKDMDTLSCLPQILEAGAVSLKIEGRMKSPRYTGGVTAVYRKYLDLCEEGAAYRVEASDRRFLRELFDRGGYTEYASGGLRDGMVAIENKPERRRVDEEFLREKEIELAKAASKEKIKGKLRFFVGEPVIITVERRIAGQREPVSVTRTGAVVQPAQTRPVDEPALRQRFWRLGDTPFEWESLEIAADGNGFLPVGQLNELRRQAMADLEAAVIRLHGRARPAAAAIRSHCQARSAAEKAAREEKVAGEEKTAKEEKAAREEKTTRIQITREAPGQRATQPRIHIAVSTPSQLRLLADYSGIDRVYLNLAALTQKEEEAALQWFFDPGTWAGKERPAFYLSLPSILRGKGKTLLESRLEVYRQYGVTGYLVHTWDQMAWLRRREPSACLQADASLYTWNQEAVRILDEWGLAGATLPVELNSRELRARTSQSPLPAELIAYGYLPVMVSAQCVQRTLEGCSGRSGLLWLKDREQKSFAVQNHCRFCLNTVYNREPLFLLDCRSEWESLGLSALRLQFTIEGEEETRGILDACLADVQAGDPVENPLAHFTRGHFRRGVE